MQRRGRGSIEQRMFNIEQPGKRKRGRPQRTFVDVVKEAIFHSPRVLELVSTALLFHICHIVCGGFFSEGNA